MVALYWVAGGVPGSTWAVVFGSGAFESSGSLGPQILEAANGTSSDRSDSVCCHQHFPGEYFATLANLLLVAVPRDLCVCLQHLAVAALSPPFLTFLLCSCYFEACLVHWEPWCPHLTHPGPALRAAVVAARQVVRSSAASLPRSCYFKTISMRFIPRLEDGKPLAIASAALRASDDGFGEVVGNVFFARFYSPT